MNARIARITAIAAAVAGLGLSACTKADRDEAKAKTDQAVAEMKDKASEMKADAKQQMAETKADIKQGAAEMKADIKEASADAKAKMSEAGADAKSKSSEMKADASNAMDKAKVAVSDATITTSVKAELAKDDTLKARDINVDTDGGRVSLRGTAPTSAAKERATTLARAVDGVVSVNNELKVQGS